MEEAYDWLKPIAVLVNTTLDELRVELGKQDVMKSASDLLVALGEADDEDRYVFDGHNAGELTRIFRDFNSTLPAYLPGRLHLRLVEWLPLLALLGNGGLDE